MHIYLILFTGVAALSSSNVLAQSSAAPNLPGFLSAVQSLATILAPSSSASTSSSQTSIPETSSRSRITSTSISATQTTSPSSPAAATASSTAGTASSAAHSGIDAHTRTIILAVVIPVGILLLAGLILCLALCCRRRRRSRKVSSPVALHAEKDDWEHHNTSHHGYNSTPSLRTGTSHGAGMQDAAPLMAAAHHRDHHNGHNSLHDAVPLMTVAHHGDFHNSHNSQHSTAPLMGAYHPRNEHDNLADSNHMLPTASSTYTGSGPTVHPAYRNSIGNTNVQNPFTPTPPISRKPVPSRDSSGSNISGISSRHSGHHSNHHVGLSAGVGTGVLVGAAAVHHHNKHQKSSGSLVRPESYHRPLSSHPNDPSSNPTTATDTSSSRDRRRSSPYVRDDVSSMHRSSARYSQSPTEPLSAVSGPAMAGAEIIAPTAAQRRSLQSRNSSYSDGRDTPRGPSRSPKRRSLTGGGEMWQASPEETPVMPESWRRHGGGEVLPPNPSVKPALTNNKHNSATRDSRQFIQDENTDSSTSNDSWESAQYDLNPWEYNDTNRYPRLSGGTVNSMAPLVPQAMAWNEAKQRRYSGEHSGRHSGGGRYSYGPGDRRSSGGADGKRRLRFSEGEPELYNEHGLVGRAL